MARQHSDVKLIGGEGNKNINYYCLRYNNNFILTVKRTKYFWLFSPTQLFTLKNKNDIKMYFKWFSKEMHNTLPPAMAGNRSYHGQWWSIFRMQRWQTEQWCARSGLMLQHFGHLKNTWPSLKPSCWIISLVALPLGTAP